MVGCGIRLMYEFIIVKVVISRIKQNQYRTSGIEINVYLGDNTTLSYPWGVRNRKRKQDHDQQGTPLN